MAKRFTDTELWDKEWFMNLSCKLKCLVKFVRDKADIAGVWSPNWVLAKNYIGERVTEDELLKIDGGKQFVKIGAKIYCIGFIEFQYGQLSEKSPVHRKVLTILDSHKIDYKYPINRVQEEEKEEEKEEDKEEEKEMEEETDKERDLRKKMREIFVETHDRKKGISYYWSAADAVGIKNVVPKIKATTKARDGDTETVIRFWQTLLDNLPDWYFANGFTPPIINKKFNEIISKIHTPNVTNNANIDRQVAEILARGNPYARTTDKPA